jgi:hypothetical protein
MKECLFECVYCKKKKEMQKEWHQAKPNLIKEEKRYINKSGNGGREKKK